ncbi:hypothetical protein H6G89_23395 [Oscillatoria sp. FACHB-1407]|uniref:hypothetical protein n=1 Tax=Oscillatoria sp. FACHB-1407 TaxID=2692847 RepID=UPI0016873328|nr:hypothetical protein [Oscillatoria sp. FACHB-1407]MBD2463951.1 hypothetical protein [Oscillatoria sp. FACHB-1407]
MVAQIPPTLKHFIDEHPLLYRKLCFWADKRGIENPSVQVQGYLTELIIEANTNCDNTELLIKWTKVLSHQERIALAYLSPIQISDYAIEEQWYKSQKGEYSVMDEPVIQEIVFEGKQQGIITRNRYDCLVLNCDRLLIIDVDIAAPRQDEIQDCSKNCQLALSQKQAIAAVESLAEQFPKLGFRVYRTRNGLRLLCTTQPFDPLDAATHRFMQNLYVDPLYARLCKFQATFRARLTPKPWRVDEEYEERFIYDRITGLVLPESSPYAVCHLIEVIGEQKILPEFEPLIQAHDSYCRVSRLGLELA